MRRLNGEILRFLLAGSLNTGFVYIAFAILIYFGLHYAWATLIAGALGLLAGFLLFSRYVFRKRGPLLGFLAVFVMMYLANIGTQKVFLEFVYNNEYLSGFVGILVTTTLSFVGNRYFVFVGPRTG